MIRRNNPLIGWIPTDCDELSSLKAAQAQGYEYWDYRRDSRRRKSRRVMVVVVRTRNESKRGKIANLIHILNDVCLHLQTFFPIGLVIVLIYSCCPSSSYINPHLYKQMLRQGNKPFDIRNVCELECCRAIVLSKFITDRAYNAHDSNAHSSKRSGQSQPFYSKWIRV